MYTAISHPRLHPEKSRCVGIYAPEGPTPPAESQVDDQGTGAEEKAPKRIAKDPMAGISPDACVCVPQPKGPFFKTMGRADRWNRVWLLPEEAIYLVERGSLYLKWPSTITEPVRVDDDEEDMEVPMSLEAAYACMMGHAGLTLERYVVYSGLKRIGYTVVRAPSWYGTVEEPEHETENDNPSTGSYISGISACWSRFYESIASIVEKDYSAQGPLIGVSTPRHYSKYSQISIYYLPSRLTKLQTRCFESWP
jgi:tRNA-splicing endonuclease subunit Sen54